MIHLKTITRFASTTPDAAAFVSIEFTMNWRQFKAETEKKIAFLLGHYGRELPHQVCYIAKNRIDLMPWLSACTTLGIPVAGLDYTLPTHALKELSVLAQTDLLLVSSILFANTIDINSLAPTHAMVLDIDSLTHSHLGITPLRDNVDILEHIAELRLPQKPFRSIGFTSGTTSLPKVVMRTESFDQRRFAYFSGRYGFCRQDKFLLSMPLYHAAGNGWARLFLTLGATVFLAPVDQSGDLSITVAQHHITVSVMTPVLLEQLLEQIESCHADRPAALRWLLIGGKHFPAPLKLRAMKILGPCLYEYYGTTETGVNTIAEPQDIAAYPQSVGIAYEGNDICIVDADGRRLGAYSNGTVAVSSYMKMTSYLNEQARQIEVDGLQYLLTADQGYLDNQGRLFLLNRANNPDQHAHLYRLEDAIRSLPNIADVAIIYECSAGISRTDCALSVRKNERSDEGFLLTQVQHLAANENITFSRCQVLPSIPYSPSGKVRVRDLQSLMAV